MKQILQILFLLLKNLIAHITKKPMQLNLPQATHKKADTIHTESRFTQQENGVFANGKTEKSATILLTGDLLCQRKQQNAYRTADGNFDFSDMFGPVTELFKKADLVVGNLETICDTTLAYMHESITADGLPFLNAPKEFITALKNAGFDAVCSANNHNCDGGLQGLTETLKNLQNAELPVTGIFNNADEARYLLFDVNGIRVALLAYSCFYNFKSSALNKIERNTHLNLYRTKKAATDIDNAKKDGADFIITYIHWGSEYTHRVSMRQKRIAKRLAKAGSNLIAGSHSHVLQPFDTVNGVPCLYSFGNFISSQTKDGTQESVLLQVKLQKENGKTKIADLCAIPCKTSVDAEDQNHRVEHVNAETDKEIFERITKITGKKLHIKK